MVFDHVPEGERSPDLKRFFWWDALPGDQAGELAQEHLAVLAGEALSGLVVAAVLGAFDERIGFHLDLGVEADQRPEVIEYPFPGNQLVVVAGVLPEALQVRAKALIGTASS